MDMLNMYTELNILDDAMMHVKAKLAERFPDMGMGDHDEAYYQKLDDELKTHPYVVGDKTYSDLRSLAAFYNEEFITIMNTGGRPVAGDMPKNDEEMDINMATGFGV
ncbi:MAG: hypothetical protein K6F34_01085 [Lachnospiraceae bacterium]|nr:hypothetical protein [Lachnospiraceae bacterium]